MSSKQQTPKKQKGGGGKSSGTSGSGRLPKTPQELIEDFKNPAGGIHTIEQGNQGGADAATQVEVREQSVPRPEVLENVKRGQSVSRPEVLENVKEEITETGNSEPVESHNYFSDEDTFMERNDFGSSQETGSHVILTMKNFAKFEEYWINYSMGMKGNPARVLTNNEVEFKLPKVDKDNPEHHKELKDFRDGKSALCSLLLRHICPEVYELLKVQEGFSKCRQEMDLFTLWRLIRQVVEGRGSAGALAAARELLTCKQEGTNIASYVTRFNEASNKLLSTKKTSDELIQVLLSCIFAAGLNQMQFKDQIKKYVSSEEWTSYQQMSKELILYDTNMRVIDGYAGEGLLLDQKVSANVADYKGRICFNCGATPSDHYTKQCIKPKAKCKICGYGHLSRLHDQAEQAYQDKRDRYHHKRSDARRAERSDRGTSSAPKGRDRDSKSDKKKPDDDRDWKKEFKSMKKTLARLAQYVEDVKLNAQRAVDEDYDRISEEDEESQYSDERSVSIDEDEDDEVESRRVVVLEGYPSIVARGANVSTSANESQASVTNVEQPVVALKGTVVDTGCSNGHVLTRRHMRFLRNLKKSRAVINGVGGIRVNADYEGQFGRLGRAVIVPNSEEGLLSLSLILGSVKGAWCKVDERYLTLMDESGKAIFQAENGGDGAWRIDDVQMERIAALAGEVEDPDEAGDDDEVEGDDLVTPPGVLPPLPSILNEDDKRRATEAYSLCDRLGHPGPSAIRRGLANDSFVCTNTHLTRQDFDNGLQLYGPCPACTEGKMRADPIKKKSDSVPARDVGDVLHCDLLPLGERARGGIENLLFAMDERSGYVHLIPVKGKDESFMRLAFSVLQARYLAYSHTIKCVQVDHESALICLETFLNRQGVRMNKHPAGHHEKTAERNIQTFKGIKRAIAAGLIFDIDDLPVLMVEHYQAAAFSMNVTPRKRTHAYTPTFLFTGRKPIVPEYGFGTLGLIHTRSRGREKRSEHCILLAPDSPHMHGVRVFVPATSTIVTGVKFEPTRRIPEFWRLRVRQFVAVPPPPGLNPHPPALDPPVVPSTEASPPVQTATPVPPVALDPSPDLVIEDQKGMDEPVVESTSTDPPTKMGAKDTSPTSPDKGQKGTRQKVSKGKSKVTHSPPVPSKEVRVRPPAKPPPKPVVNQSIGGRPLRSASKPQRFREDSDVYADTAEVCVRRVSLSAALKDREERDLVYEAVWEEIDNMEDNKVGEFVKFDDIPKTVRHKRGFWINSHMFLTDKYLASGIKDRKKARMVVNGNEENSIVVGDTFSPTVNPISVMAQLNVTVVRKYKLAAYDIKGAFLKAPVGDKKIYLRIPPEVAKIWVQRYPQRKKYLSEDGSLFYVLNKYLYGLQESPHAFNQLLHGKLVEMGFQQSTADQCLYTKTAKDGLLILSTHVDDLLFSSPNVSDREWFESELEKSFEIKKQYDNLSYLGMSIDYNERKRTLKVSQVGAVKEIVSRIGYDHLVKRPPTPAVAEKLLMSDSDDDSEPCDKKEFLSLVMSMMYLARLTRPDILMPVTVLASRCANPTTHDMSGLRRVVRYLAGTLEYGIVFDSTPIKPHIYADASHNIHSDGHGHAGIILSLGSAPIHCRSFKIKLVTRSSTESELFALEEATTYAGWLKMLLRDLGVASWNEPILTHQDNKSAIIIAKHGPSFKRFKHMLVRKAFVKERITCGDIVLDYLKTDLMVADMLTKPLNGIQLSQHCNMLRIM